MAVAQPTAGQVTQPSRLKSMWKSISIVFESRVATVGMILVLFWVILGIISLFWTPFPPNAPLFVQNLPPNTTNWLGTDQLGRDILSRLMTGTQVILLKTRVPQFGFGAYIQGLSVIAFLVALVTAVLIWAQMFSRFKKLFIALLVAAAVLLPFYILAIIMTWSVVAWILLGLLLLILGGMLLAAYIWGWLTAGRLGNFKLMITWTVALILAVALLGAVPILPAGTVPTFSIPIGVAIWGVIGSVIVGAFLGLNAGYRGGWADQGTMQVLDALIAFPVIVLYLVVIAALGQGDLVVILAITITGAPGVARLIRSLALDIKTRDYIRAAETRGESVWYIMMVEILPNARGPILVDSMLRVGYAIFAIGTLGFLGIGLPPPDPDWGNMVNEARKNIFINPWAVIPPSVAIASLVIGLNLFADGLREELGRYQK
jgi:ABC-type dipeptide/oligopeptide/nickel transport system permease subunit